jgi:hypothetical protein
VPVSGEDVTDIEAVGRRDPMGRFGAAPGRRPGDASNGHQPMIPVAPYAPLVHPQPHSPSRSPQRHSTPFPGPLSVLRRSAPTPPGARPTVDHRWRRQIHDEREHDCNLVVAGGEHRHLGRDSLWRRRAAASPGAPSPMEKETSGERSPGTRSHLGCPVVGPEPTTKTFYPGKTLSCCMWAVPILHAWSPGLAPIP